LQLRVIAIAGNRDGRRDGAAPSREKRGISQAFDFQAKLNTLEDNAC
jgi:hypothetical protein